ncbi:TonB-dependent receptor [Turneriella parva]|uniref:TonB-dependent receptor n=1 Tax=Turneriella parva (strain ATCC BAA-1111 / DSM 21527 / NCTC 11395 / H) TaxID=869212 RepID=I4B0S4_TURPD|nr:TonB-dependent receptor [Turneriella parva]AFM10881.1 TonB-dependent receptor [Turneriella parva DSM 21527]
MNQSPKKQGNLSRTATRTARGLIPLMLLVSISGIGAQRKGAKPAAAPAAVATSGATGTIRGRVLDSANGEAMIGVTAVIKELGVYGITDIDGNYVITNVPVGEQTVTYQITGYQPSATKVTVGTGKAAVANVTLNYKVSSEVVVTAKRVDNTAASLLSKQKKAAAAQDAISAEQISKSPDSDASDAAKRVTGVSIVGGGQFVFIRGMSERYSMVQVNGSQVPSPIPTRRVVPLDIFPVSLLDNVTIIKSYLPELPGEFGGGVININTKDYPDEREAKVGLSFGMNSITTFQPFGTYKGGSLDALGYDDGGRALPASVVNNKISPFSFGEGFTNAERIEFAKKFSNVWSRQDISGRPAGKIEASFGKTYEIDETRKLGFLVSGFFQESSQTEKGTFKRYLADKSVAADYKYEDFSYSTLKSAQISTAFASSKQSKFKLNSFYTHKSTDTTRQNKGQYDFSNQGTKTILSFQESSLIFNQLAGEHRLGFLDSEINWFGTVALAGRDTPDTRVTRYGIDGQFQQTRNMTRYFNKHNEQVYQAGASWSIPFEQWSGLKSKFTLGADGSYRNRETISRRFTHDLTNTAIDLTQTAEQIFLTGAPMMSEVTGTSEAEGFDAYNAKLAIGAGYTQFDVPLIPRVRLVTGVRAESWEQTSESFNIFARNQKVNAALKSTNFMPAANLIYTPIDDLNIRFGASQTLNRPDFIEASNFRVFDDLVTGALIKGNPNLSAATINNYDTRIEWFPAVGEIIAISGFYKDIRNPIEATVGALADDLQFTYVNQSRAKLLGAEFEVRKKLGFITSYIEEFSALFNATYVTSEITVNPNLTTAETNPNRPLQGQSPWLLNAGLYYDREKSGTSVAVLYNIFGRRIAQVGVNGLPNTYEETYGTLDMIGKQKLGEKMDLKVSVGNILNPLIEVSQGSGSERQEIQTYRRGVNISFGLTYKL